VKVRFTRFVIRLFPGLLIVSVAILIVGFASVHTYNASASKSMPVIGASDFASIDIHELLPDTPQIISPGDQLVVNGESVFFVWHSTGERNSYELSYSWNSDFDSPETIVTQDTAYSLTSTSTVSTSLFWKIRSVSADKSVSQWTSVHSLTFMPAVKAWRCNHNCSQCPNPCGRRGPELN